MTADPVVVVEFTRPRLQVVPPVRAFVCPHCKRVSTSKGGMTRHRKSCLRNPSVRNGLAVDSELERVYALYPSCHPMSDAELVQMWDSRGAFDTLIDGIASVVGHRLNNKLSLDPKSVDG